MFVVLNLNSTLKIVSKSYRSRLVLADVFEKFINSKFTLKLYSMMLDDADRKKGITAPEGDEAEWQETVLVQPPAPHTLKTLHTDRFTTFEQVWNEPQPVLWDVDNDQIPNGPALRNWFNVIIVFCCFY